MNLLNENLLVSEIQNMDIFEGEITKFENPQSTYDYNYNMQCGRSQAHDKVVECTRIIDQQLITTTCIGLLRINVKLRIMIRIPCPIRSKLLKRTIRCEQCS